MAFDNMLRFIEFLGNFNLVERTIMLKWQNKWESDSEHTFQLAVFCWYLNEVWNIWLDTNMILKYALVHDLVEVYAWDTYFYMKNSSEAEYKEQREKQAKEKIKNNFSEFVSLNKFIENYEKKVDEESKFVYAVDKILPVMNIYIDNWRAWKQFWVSLEMLLDMKTSKITKSKHAYPFWSDFIKKLKENKWKLFNV